MLLVFGIFLIVQVFCDFFFHLVQKLYSKVLEKSALSFSLFHPSHPRADRAVALVKWEELSALILQDKPSAEDEA